MFLVISADDGVADWVVLRVLGLNRHDGGKLAGALDDRGLVQELVKDWTSEVRSGRHAYLKKRGRLFF